MRKVAESYKRAREIYGDYGVDTDDAVKILSAKPISLQCWQGDDVRGFEGRGIAVTGGIIATGNYPGKARTHAELKDDLHIAMRLSPGPHRLSLHASYGEFNRAVDRDEVEPKHFDGWIKWAKDQRISLDMNATLFSHPLSEAGFTLSSRDAEIRRFWVEHVRRTRRVAAYIGEELGSPCVHNLWIPDGMKDQCVDRAFYRNLLLRSLDEIFAEKYSTVQMVDTIESKLFGLGSESFVVGSHDLYLGYAVSRGVGLCVDTGHYHPTESVGDKISALLPFIPSLMIHFSRGVRWDSDHVPIVDDQLRDVASEVVRCGALGKVHLALDYFDASINRIAAWVIGSRAIRKAFLLALLEPATKLKKLEETGDYTGRLALLEEAKTLPAGAVWDKYCADARVPLDGEWMEEVQRYETNILSKRS